MYSKIKDVKKDIFFLLLSLILLWISYKPILMLKNYTQWSLYSFLTLAVFPIFLLLITKSRLKDYGFSKGDISKGIRYVIYAVLIFLPFLIYSARLGEFQNYYPRYPGARNSIKLLVYWEFLFFIYLLGWEYFFRGFLLFTLKKYTGIYSILIQAIPFALLHIGKPMPEVYASFFAALLLGYVCIRSKTFWPALFIHWIISVLFDILVIFL